MACKGKVQFCETSTCGVQEKCTLLDRRDFDFGGGRQDDGARIMVDAISAADPTLESA
jgi:hypothetical protein